MKRIIALVAAALTTALFLLPTATNAQQFGEQITDFGVVATLQSNGVLVVDETIEYDFGATSHHGIYRDIPSQYRDDAGQRYRLKVSVGAVSMDGHEVESEIEASPDLTRLKLGDPDTLISGAHTYNVRYSLAPIVNTGDGGDILKYNVTGNGWEVPISHASFILDLGRLAPRNTPICYTGAASSTAHDCTINAHGFIVQAATTNELAPGEGLSIFTDLPSQSVANHLQPYVPPRPSPLLFVIPFLLLAGLLLCLGRFILKLLRAWQLRRDQTIVAQYEAPANFTPIELGLLNDDRTGLVEITATLVDLAVRGHIKITQTKPKKLLSKAAYQFDRLTAADPLKSHETQLLRALFGDATTCKLADVDNDAMAKAITKIHAATGVGLTKRGIYRRTPGLWRVIVPGVLLLMSAVFLTISTLFLAFPGEEWALLPYLIFVSTIGGLIVAAGFLIFRTDGLTPEGAKIWAQVRGFKLYLTVAEQDRLNFSDAPAKTPELFNKLLPAAIALGVEKQWAKQFEGIDVMGSSGWYGGYPGSTYGAAFLASSLSSDFSSSIQQNFTVSSSGSSGGGFSGGGFGGGGGGSW